MKSAVGMAEEEDKKMAESWKADADGILVFVSLMFCSLSSTCQYKHPRLVYSVVALVVISIQDLWLNSQDTSAFYLQNIYQLLSDPNRSNPIVPSTPSIPLAFSPPTYTVWVNTLWFLSLAISLTCSLLAMLLQQWACRYIKITQTWYSPHKRACIHAFFAEGIEKLHLPWAVEALPTLLHLSLFLFFASLLIFLFNINHTVFSVVTWWVGLCAATYVGVTFMPLFWRDSPYYAPLSLPAWFLVSGTLYIIFMLVGKLVGKCFGFRIHYCLKLYSFKFRFRSWLLLGMGGAAEDATLKQSLKIDGHLFQWMVASLDEDHELEQFFAGIPGFFESTVIKDPRNAFRTGWTLLGTLLELVNQTLSSCTLPNLVKWQRIAVCRKAMDVASFPVHSHPLDLALLVWDKFSCSIDSGLILKVATYNNPADFNRSQCMISIILARVQTHDNNWCELATSHLGISESILQDYLVHGDSASLANLNCVIWQAIDFHLNEQWFTIHMTKTLELVSNFDVQGTLPELQHDFCTLWNELILKSQTTEEYRVHSVATHILAKIRHTYVSLHWGTGSAPVAFSTSTSDNDCVPLEPSSYPLCTITSHRPDSTSHIHKDVIATTGLLAHAEVTSSHPTILGGGTILDLDTPTDVCALSLPTPSPDHANLLSTNEPSLDDLPAAPQCCTSITAPSCPAAQMTPVNDEDRHSPVTPLDSPASFVIWNSSHMDTTTHTVNPISCMTALTPTLPLSSTSHSIGTVTPWQNEETTAVPLSTVPDTPPLSIPVFTRNTPPACALSSLPSDSATTGPDHIPDTLVFFPLIITAAFLLIPS